MENKLRCGYGQLSMDSRFHIANPTINSILGGKASVELLLDDHQDVPHLIRLADLGPNFFDRAALSRDHR
jgi:hypothetical protein